MLMHAAGGLQLRRLRLVLLLLLVQRDARGGAQLRQRRQLLQGDAIRHKSCPYAGGWWPVRPAVMPVQPIAHLAEGFKFHGCSLWRPLRRPQLRRLLWLLLLLEHPTVGSCC